MTDLRLADAAVGSPALTLEELSALAAYVQGRPSFASVACVHGLLTPEEVTLPIPHAHPKLGVALNAVLLQNVWPPERLRDVVAEFAAKLAAEPKVVERKRLVEDEAAPGRLPPKVAALLGSAAELWEIPEPVRRIREMLAYADTPVDEVVAAIEAEPALAARLVRMAGGPPYAVSGAVTEVRPIVQRLGVVVMRRVVATAALLEQLDGTAGRAERAPFWGHALETAHAAERICRDRRLGDAEVFFLAGLLHEVGRLAVARHLPARWGEIQQEVRAGASIEKAERKVLGTNSAAIGTCVAARWRLPAAVVEAAAHHLDDLLLLESFQIPMASKVAGVFCGLAAGRVEPASAARFLKIGAPVLAELRAAAAAEAARSRAALFDPR
jgi:HD-like signal output (HDOD) protein